MMEDFNNGVVDSNLAYRMRKVNSEQFYTLVKMHLSFELELNSEENDAANEKAKLKKWGILNFSKKPKSAMNLSKGSEGVTLTKEGIHQIKQLVTWLSEDKCIEQEGIFRRTGKLTRQQDLKTALTRGLPLDLSSGKYSVHDCASVLKGYLADLSEPVLTDHYYPAYCQIAEFCSSSNNTHEARLLRSLQLLLLLLPTLNRILLKHIIYLLNKTAAFEHSNKMNCNTLATLFTPHLLCPRKLSPEALHLNSQNLSGLISFMIKKGKELFEIPPKLMTDIRAYWIDQEKKLLSPQIPDPNESTSDTTGTAHTVFSFVDHKLTAKATATQDTQAALAQLYAHIQAMPESAKKRRLVKQFNKENGQGTPRHIKISTCKTKSLSDSIKKHIFQKKVVGSKKVMEAKYTCNFSRSSSEENMLSNTYENTMLLPKMLSKSDDELSTDNYKHFENKNLIISRNLNSSTVSLENSNASSLEKDCQFSKEDLEIKKCIEDISDLVAINEKSNKINRYSRNLSEPPDLFSSQTCIEDTGDSDEFKRQVSNPEFPIIRNLESIEDQVEPVLPNKSNEKASFILSPLTQHKLRNRCAIHTSTPSNLLRKSLGLCDYMLTPISDEKSTSPITQSANKMSKAMQETMMTPRSRKPVVMISASNICNLSTLNSSSSIQSNSNTNLKESNENEADTQNFISNTVEGKENTSKINNHNIVDHDVSYVPNILQKSSVVSMTSTFKEYRLSRSVLTASPVDLSFTSRTGDYEQSESDLNALNDDEKNRVSDIIKQDSTNNESYYNKKFEDETYSPRKKNNSFDDSATKKVLKQKRLSESTLNSVKLKDFLPETSF